MKKNKRLRHLIDGWYTTSTEPFNELVMVDGVDKRRAYNKGSKTNHFYVYSHLDKDGKCIYIGKGSGNRIDTSRAEHEAAVESLMLVSGVSNQKSLELEKSFIKQVGLENLLNKRP